MYFESEVEEFKIFKEEFQSCKEYMQHSNVWLLPNQQWMSFKSTIYRACIRNLIKVYQIKRVFAWLK